MRCPYCHVHYLDGEKACPICGKRALRPSASQPGAGSKTAGTKSRPKPASRPAKSKKPAKPASKHPPRPAPVSTSGSGWDAPPNRTAKKKRGCLFPFLILLVLFAVITLIANLTLTDITDTHTIPSIDNLLDSLEHSDWIDDEDSIWYDSPIFCIVGTWESQTTGDRITFHDDGSVTVSSGSVTGVCTEDDVFCRMADSIHALSSDNRGRAEDYPPEDYVYCEFSMFPKDEDGLYLDSQTFDLLIFLPRDLYESGTPPEPGAEITAFHYDEFDRSADSYLDTYVMQ